MFQRELILIQKVYLTLQRGSNIDTEGDGSITQNITTRSGTISVKPKRYLQLAILGLLSCQTKYLINSSTDLHSVSIFKAQMDYD